MEVRAVLSEPSGVKREGDKWILSFDELNISDFSERDMPVFERLYELGWKPSNSFLGWMCEKLPAEFILKHEPRARVVETLRKLWEQNNTDTTRKFAGMLTAEEKRAMIQKKIDNERSNYSGWRLRDYDWVIPVIATFPEVAEIPQELRKEIASDLERWCGWVRNPVAYGHETWDARHFREGLGAAAKLKELGVLPEDLERLAREVVAKISGTLERRLTSPEIKKADQYAEVARAALPFAEWETRAKILSALLERSNGK
jgi:hypothetical protein